jgi:hypothetical protein
MVERHTSSAGQPTHADGATAGCSSRRVHAHSPAGSELTASVGDRRVKVARNSPVSTGRRTTASIQELEGDLDVRIEEVGR